MKQKIRFISIVIWILFSRTYDAYSTYQHTPNLEHEANPLVSVMGLDWFPLLSVVGFLTGYSIYAFYISTFKNFNLFPKEQHYNFSQFIGYLYLGKKVSWVALFYQFPKDMTRFNAYMGHLFARCLVFAGIVSTIMWLLIQYSDFYPPYHSATLIYSVLIMGSVFIIYHWNASHYIRYQRNGK